MGDARKEANLMKSSYMLQSALQRLLFRSVRLARGVSTEFVSHEQHHCGSIERLNILSARTRCSTVQLYRYPRT